MIKRKVTISLHDSESAWTEDYIEDARGLFTEADNDAKLWALLLVEKYNRTLRPGERERFIDKVTVEEVEMADQEDEVAEECEECGGLEGEHTEECSEFDEDDIDEEDDSVLDEDE
jgi:hypothetical protein